MNQIKIVSESVSVKKRDILKKWTLEDAQDLECDHGEFDLEAELTALLTEEIEKEMQHKRDMMEAYMNQTRQDFLDALVEADKLYQEGKLVGAICGPLEEDKKKD